MILLEYFYNPEKILKARLERNPFYPFVVMQPKVFVLSFRIKRQIVGLIVCSSVAILTAVVSATQHLLTQYIVIPVFVFVYFLPWTICGSGKRVLVIDMVDFVYEYYADDELLHCGHVYNIYIRVKTLRTSGNRYYRLIVDGFRLDVPFDVTLMPSTRPDKLIRLGRRLSANIGINFFDCEDSSTRHVIRHRRPEKFTS